MSRVLSFFLCVVSCVLCLLYLSYYFSVNLCSHYFCEPDKNKKYLSVGNFKILSFVVFFVVVVAWAVNAYTSLCRVLNYLLKLPCFILDYPNVVRFLIFETHFLFVSCILRVVAYVLYPMSYKISNVYFLFSNNPLHLTKTDCFELV